MPTCQGWSARHTVTSWPGLYPPSDPLSGSGLWGHHAPPRKARPGRQLLYWPGANTPPTPTQPATS